MIKAPRSKTLNAQLADRVRPRHAVGRARNLNGKLTLQMTHFEQNDGQVMNEQQCVNQRRRIAYHYNVFIIVCNTYEMFSTASKAQFTPLPDSSEYFYFQFLFNLPTVVEVISA